MKPVHLLLVAALVASPLVPAASAIGIYAVEAWLWMGDQGCGGTLPYYTWFSGASVDDASVDEQGRPHAQVTYHYVDLHLYNHCPGGLAQVPGPAVGESSSRSHDYCPQCSPYPPLP